MSARTGKDAGGRGRRGGRRPVRPAWTGPMGLYSPRATWLHAVPPGWKLGTVAALSIAATFVRNPLVALGGLVLSLVLLACARVPARGALRALGPIALLAVGLGLFQWWSRGWEAAAVTTCTLISLVVLATVVTATTRTDRMLDALVRGARPLRRLGLDPEVLALTVALMLRTIPALVELVSEVRDAARARGLERDPRALLVPFALRTVARAHSTGDALAARGILD